MLFRSAAGAWKGLMLSFAFPDRVAYVDANYSTFTLDAFRAAVLGLALLGLIYARRAPRLAGTPWAIAVGLLVLLDLWSVERRQIAFTDRATKIFAADGAVKAIADDPELFRVLPAAPRAGYMADNYLMIHRLRSVLGYQGMELHRYDELLGGKNSWLGGQGNLFNLNVWRLLAVKYVVTEQPVDHPALAMVGDGPVPSYDGPQVYVYRYQGQAPYAMVVAEALKVRDEQVVPILIDSRFDPRRLLLVPEDSPVGVSSLAALPDTVPVSVQTTEVRPGAYRFQLETPAPKPGYLFVSENYYPAWKARVDGKPVSVVRAQMSLMAVPLAQGARVVELEFRSSTYGLGRGITLTTLVLLLGATVYGRIRERREGVRG